MLTVTKADRFSITRCTFADLSDLLSGQHVSEKNRDVFDDKLATLASLGTSGWARDDFGGCKSREEIEGLMRDGWADGAAKASGMTPSLANLVPPPKSIRRRIRWADTGTELNIDRALAGQWDVAYRNTRTEYVAGAPKVISLACNFGGNSSLTTNELFWCAAQMIVVTDLLEKAGYQVELRAVKCNALHTGNRHVLLDVVVKQAGQPMRADTIASVFGHAGVYRTYGHTLLMTSPYAIGSGLGMPTRITETLKSAVAAGLTDAADYVFEHGYNMRQAADNITKALTQFTAPAGATGA